MITNEYGNNVLRTPQTAEALHTAAQRAVERAYRKPGNIFRNPGFQTEVVYEPMGGWCLIGYKKTRVETDYRDAIFTLALMWAQESR